jgi:hypothetical protein
MPANDRLITERSAPLPPTMRVLTASWLGSTMTTCAFDTALCGEPPDAVFDDSHPAKHPATATSRASASGRR